MAKLEEGIWDFVRPKNKFESQGESIQDSCKTSNDVRGRDLGSEESTREEVGCGGNEDVKEEPKWSLVRLCMCHYYISIHNNREIYVQNASTS